MRRSAIKTQILTLFFSLIFPTLSSQTFSEMTTINLSGVSEGSVAWGDYDNDGYLDILVVGSGNAKVYKNSGGTAFSEQPGITATLPGVYNASAAWGDYNNDGYLDIILTGNTTKDDYTTGITKLYKNNGNNSFTEITGNLFAGVSSGSVAWSDYDNDGDLDFAIMGSTITNSRITKIYKNNGPDRFDEQVSIQLTGAYRGSLAWGDYDNDGYPDLIQTGASNAGSGLLVLHHNNGDDTFTSNPFSDNYYYGASVWNDYNNDGNLDLFLCGYRSNPNSNFYLNNGDGTFTIQADISISPGILLSSAAWGDYNNDGFADLLISGGTNFDDPATRVSKLYKNNGNSTFSEISAGLTGLIYTSVAWGDYDNDGDLDILLSGSDGSSDFTKIYRNDSPTANTEPAAPVILPSQVSGANVTLNWESANDDFTPSLALTYNVIVGTSSGSGNILSPGALPSNGFRQIPVMGNGQLLTTFHLKNLKPDVYYWRVQAIDNGYKGGAFSSEGTFTVSTYAQAFNVSPSVTGSFDTYLQWARGTGIKCAVFIKEADYGTAVPVNGTTYSASSVFGSGTQIGSTGWYCVYNGTQNSVTVTNLKPNTSYTVYACEMASATTYIITTANNNPVTFTTNCFTEMFQDIYYNYSKSNVTWGDYNNDGNFDFFAGTDGTSKIFKNNGDNTFAEQTTPYLFGTLNGMGAWGDYNNDGYLDLLTIGSGITKIYKNNGETDGNNTFTDQNSFYPDGVLIGLETGSTAWADLDSDGDLDIILSGASGSLKTTKIFRNNGNSTFTEQPGISLPGFNNGAVTVADYNNDGFMDICIGGDLPTGYDTQIFMNSGDFIFTRQVQISLGGIFNGGASWGDYNSDGNIDLFLTGMWVGSSLYKNNGDNTFSLTPIPDIPSMNDETISTWGDFDNDGDLDLFISGYSNEDLGYITIVYRNDGDGTFVRMNSIHLADCGGGTISLADYDNDGDLDILIDGNGNERRPFTKIFRNDIINANVIPEVPGGLTESIDREGVTFSWDPVTTDATPSESITYNIRVGKAIGKEEVISPHSSLDGFRMISGNGNMQNNTSFLLKNLSPGDYYWSVQAIDNAFAGGSFATDRAFTVTPLQAQNLTARLVDNKSLMLNWERGNGERCAVFAKQGISADALPANNTTYLADNILGYGSQIGSSTGWYCIYNGRADSVLLKGLAPNNSYSVYVIEYSGNPGFEKYYTTTSTSNPGVFETTIFSEQTSMPFNSKSHYASAAFADYNNDNYLDILVTGWPGSPVYVGVTHLYKNNGNNTFTDENSLPVEGALYSDVAWADYDNDGYLDLLISGSSTYNPATPFTKLYHNDNGTGFTETAVSIIGVYYSSITWGDYNRDGYIDFAIAGATGLAPGYNPVSKIYKNNGNGTFTQLSVSIAGVYDGAMDWGDYDNDGDLDLLLLGSGGNCIIYQNNSNDVFVEFTPILDDLNFYPVSADWGDYNNDGYIDLISAGSSRINIYKNNGDKTFSIIPNLNLPFAGDGNVKWADFNNDGRLDFVWSGRIISYDPYSYIDVTRIYLNGGNDTFYEYPDLSMIGVNNPALTCGDYDNDGDIDFLLAGQQQGGSFFTSMFRNNIIMKAGNPSPNIKPIAPAGLSNTSIPGGVILKWDPVKANEANYKSLTYNVSVTNTDNNSIITPPHSLASGIRTIAQMGNSQLDTAFILKLPEGNYKWKVQAVDQIYAGGDWSAEQTFFVKSVQAFFSSDEVCFGLPTHFTDESVATSGIASWLWDFGDGTTSTLQNPQHTYASSGSFSVKLTITDSQASTDFLVQNVNVKSKPTTNFNSDIVCQGMSTTFTNTTNNNGLTVSSWFWDFGDESESSVQNPGTHGYLGATDYTVTLRAQADNGCLDEISKTVTVASYPSAAISADGSTTLCSGGNVTLSVPLNSDYSYIWKRDGTDITGAVTNTYQVQLSGSYTASVTNKGLCTTLSSAVPVNVNPAPAAPSLSADGPVTFCQGASVVLSVTNTAGYTYEWKKNGGAVGLSSNQFIADASGKYSLVVKNSFNCEVNSIDTIVVTVYDLPNVSNIIPSGSTIFCDTGSVNLSVPVTSGNSYKWLNEFGVISGANAAGYNATSTGNYQIEITNKEGCMVRTSPINVTVKSMPDKPSITAANYTVGQCPLDSKVKLATSDMSGYKYQWLRNGTTYPNGTTYFIEDYLPQSEYIQAGDYTVEADLNGCKSVSPIFNVSYAVVPEKPEILVKGPVVWYMATKKNTYKNYRWYLNDELIAGANKYIYVANKKLGTYRVEVADDICYSSSDRKTIPLAKSDMTDFSIPAEYLVGEENDVFGKLKIYPNPTPGRFTIEMDNNVMGELDISIITQSGKEILNIKFDKTTEHFSSQIDLSGQSSGMYIINMAIEKWAATRKILVE